MKKYGWCDVEIILRGEANNPMPQDADLGDRPDYDLHCVEINGEKHYQKRNTDAWKKIEEAIQYLINHPLSTEI